MKATILTIMMVGILTTVFVSNGWADVPPPNTYGCQNAAANDSCLTDDSKKGVCTTETCSGLDYSNLDDGGAPGSREYECLICTPTASDSGCTAVPHDGKKSTLFLLLSLLWE